jgi:hypothetical protein
MEIINSLNIKSKATLYSYLRKSGVVIKSWTDDGSGTNIDETNETKNTQAIKSQLPKKNSTAKPNATLKADLEKLITGPSPTDKRNKVKFEVVSQADAKKMVKVGARCYTEILQGNGTNRKITYFDSPDKAIKEREKTNSTGRIWIEHAETKDVAYIVNKDQKPL